MCDVPNGNQKHRCDEITLKQLSKFKSEVLFQCWCTNVNAPLALRFTSDKVLV